MAFVLAVAIGMGAVVVSRGRDLAGRVVRGALNETGLSIDRLEVRSIGFAGATLGGIRLAGEGAPSVAGLFVGWTLAGLMRGRADTLRVDGLRLTARYRDGKLVIPGVDLPSADGSGGSLPFHRIELRDAHVEFATESGGAVATVQATLAASGNNLSGRIAVEGVAHIAGRPDESFALTLTDLRYGSTSGLDLRDGALDLKTTRVSLRGVALRAVPRADGIVADLSGEAESLADPMLVPRLTVALKARSAKDNITVNGTVSALSNAVVAAVRAQYAMKRGRATAEVDLAPLRFEDGRQPRDLYPALGDLLPPVEGTVSARLHADWDGKALDSAASFKLEGIALSGGGIGVANLNGALAFSSLAPPRTVGMQQVRGDVQVADLPAMPLDLQFKLDGDRLAVKHAVLAVADGTAAIRDVAFSAQETVAADVEIAAVNLAALLRLLDIDGLSGDGTIDGRLPVRVDDAGVAIEGGRLVTRGPGTLRYVASEVPEALKAVEQQGGEAMSLLRQALADFRYESLLLGVDRKAGGEGTLTVALRGGNPAVLDNHPFAVNVRLEANFDRLATIFIGGYSAADALLRRAAGK